MTSPVMPCSVVVFTIGLLLLFAHKVNMFLVLFLCHWSLIGLSKTYFFQIPEDFLLASATIPGLYLFFREYFLNNLHADTKPKAKYNQLVINNSLHRAGYIIDDYYVFGISSEELIAVLLHAISFTP